MARQYYVYIIASRSRALYTGVTGNLPRRVYEHKHKLVPGFTQAYNITRLVHYETTSDVRSAIGREKQIKGWSRAKKMALIKADNPSWADLSEGWYDDGISAKTADANAQRTAASAVRRGQRSDIPFGKLRAGSRGV